MRPFIFAERLTAPRGWVAYHLQWEGGRGYRVTASAQGRTRRSALHRLATRDGSQDRIPDEQVARLVHSAPPRET